MHYRCFLLIVIASIPLISPLAPLLLLGGGRHRLHVRKGTAASAATAERRLPPHVHGVSPLPGKQQRSSVFCTIRRSSVLLSAVPNPLNEEDENYDDDVPLVGPEQSQLSQYISSYLDRENDRVSSSSSSSSSSTSKSSTSQEYDRNEEENGNELYDNGGGKMMTHLIAIPVDCCHELLLELESIQRAILYHCPLLVHACVTGTLTRLPLLFVQAAGIGNKNDNANSDDRASFYSMTRASSILQGILQEVVQKHLFVPETVTEEETVENADADDDDDDDDDDDEDGQAADLTGANVDGIKPVILTFQSLEVDGDDNSVLLTVSKPDDPGTKQLQAVVQELQHRIHKETGWKTFLPPDPQQQQPQNGDDRKVFRPRIPFMRLPPNWKEEYLQNQIDSDSDDDDEDATLLLPSDQGGNGISPIFWAQWLDDVFGEARMREVALYQRGPTKVNDDGSTGTSDGDDEYVREQAFALPHRSVPLPKGNVALSKVESQFERYQQERMKEAAEAMLQDEQRLGQDGAFNTDTGTSPPEEVPIPDDDPLLAKTRERLERLYRQEDQDQDSQESGSFSDIVEEDLGVSFSQPQQRPADPNAVDDWTRERIEKVVASRARERSLRELSTPKEKPPISDNPVFSQYKEGTLVPASNETSSSSTTTVEELPPFPSRQHCTGFWKVLQPPTGFDVEEGNNDRSDNLVLRVDGTTAGGPILDQATRQKASGGTWRLLTSPSSSSSSATLRIRLVIPPKKERILVMSGELQRPWQDVPLAKATFSIPVLEERAAKTNSEEDVLYCTGKVWLEDAVTGNNRHDIGAFSLMKLKAPTDPKQYTVTIPRPVRNQD